MGKRRDKEIAEALAHDDHPGQQYFDFAIVPNHERSWERPSFEEEYTDVPGADKEVVTPHMREQFYQSEGWFAPDSTVYSWWEKQFTIATAYTPEVLKAFEDKGSLGKAEIDTRGDGGATSYYELPPGATELKHLIKHKKMEHGIGEAFCALYRLNDNGEYRRNLEKVKFYIENELEELDRLQANTH